MSVVGNWKLTMETPFGVQTPLLEIKEAGGVYSGTLAGSTGTAELEQLKVEGNRVSFSAKVSTPMGSFPVSFSASVDGNDMKGEYETMMGKTPFSGVRQ
ncbi:MAG TPA: hypothetical protein VF203_00150 [Burkholderiales bacterium]